MAANETGATRSTMLLPSPRTFLSSSLTPRTHTLLHPITSTFFARDSSYQIAATASAAAAAAVAATAIDGNECDTRAPRNGGSHPHQAECCPPAQSLAHRRRERERAWTARTLASRAALKQSGRRLSTLARCVCVCSAPLLLRLGSSLSHSLSLSLSLSGSHCLPSITVAGRSSVSQAY